MPVPAGCILISRRSELSWMWTFLLLVLQPQCTKPRQRHKDDIMLPGSQMAGVWQPNRAHFGGFKPNITTDDILSNTEWMQHSVCFQEFLPFPNELPEPWQIVVQMPHFHASNSKIVNCCNCMPWASIHPKSHLGHAQSVTSNALSSLVQNGISIHCVFLSLGYLYCAC